VKFIAIQIKKKSFFAHLLTPRSGDVLEKLTGSQLVKEFPTFYGNRRFIAAFRSARHVSYLFFTTKKFAFTLISWNTYA
jgi:hypothetical protein